MEEYENIVMVYSYPIDEKLLIELDKQGKEITDEIIEKNGIQQVLKDNNIWYQNKLVDGWYGRDYKIIVEVYVAEFDYMKAQKIIEDFFEEFNKGEFVYDNEEDENSDNI